MPGVPRVATSRAEVAGADANGNAPGNSTNSIWRDARVPMLLMETRIGPGRKLGRIATTEDRVELGRQLIALMAESVK